MSKPRILVVGHSHIASLMRAWGESEDRRSDIEIDFLSLRDEKYAIRNDDNDERLSPAEPGSVRRELLLSEYCALAKKADWLVFCVNGNEHNNFGMFETSNRTFENVRSRIQDFVTRVYPAWLRLLMPCTRAPIVLLPPPPPVESEEFISGTKKLERLTRVVSVRSADDRLKFWESQMEATRLVAERFELPLLSLPASVVSETGFMAEDCRGTDPSHGNRVYGERVLAHLVACLQTDENLRRDESRSGKSRTHPYSGLPGHAFWRQAISEPAFGEVDPVVEPPFKVGMKDRVATAGSCFAQHISKRLRENGFRFFLAEAVEGVGESAAERGFYDFSARYGNVYTARQLLQLFDRAFGYFRPLERVWTRAEGGFCDPFRPRIEPNGFTTERAVVEDTRRHLAAVRKMFRQLDVLVFTLGLTEAWMSKLDGAVYPMAPGVAGGEFDPQRHAFVNFSVAEVVADLRSFLAKLKLVNARARVILTVSPVPLVATYEERHVLVSTVYSKSVLRVAAEEVAKSVDNVYYFPSYEIITGNHAAGRYFEADRRSVTSEGVDHVMRIFLSRVTDAQAGEVGGASAGSANDTALETQIEALAEALCDEEMLAC